MKRNVLTFLTVTGLLSAGVVLLQYPDRPSLGPGDIAERWIDSDHLQVQIGGEWQDIHMMPLSESLCALNSPVYDQFCP